MCKKALIAVLMFLALLGLETYAYTDTDIIKEVMDRPADEVISALSSEQYIGELKTMGYYKQDYGDNNINLRNAVLRFQSDCNLPADGIQGPMFKSAMIKRLSAGSRFRSPDIVRKAPSGGLWITINRTNRILTLYKGRTVVKKYPVAIGRETDKTPQGKFYVYLKRKNPMWTGGRHAKPVAGGSPENPLGKRWMGLSLGKGNLYGIHGNNNPYSIGQRVSKGCVRMINSDVHGLYNMIPVGTPVWIGNDETLRKWGVVQKRFY